MRTTLFIIIAAGTVLLCSDQNARADIPLTLNFQGRLADVSGTPIDGSYDITFRLFTATNVEVASHTATGVTVHSGLFNVAIGPLNAPFDQPYWLELQVGSDSPMSPRIPLTASAYAYTARGLVVPGTSSRHVPGNATGDIPINNGVANAGLNADMLDGKHYSDIVTELTGTTNIYKCYFTQTTTHSQSGLPVTSSVFGLLSLDNATCTFEVRGSVACASAPAAGPCPTDCPQTNYVLVNGATCSTFYTYRQYVRTCSCTPPLVGKLQQ